MFFSNNIADTIQLISLPLTLIGFTLTVVEIFYDNISKRLEKYLDNHALDWRNGLIDGTEAQLYYDYKKEIWNIFLFQLRWVNIKYILFYWMLQVFIKDGLSDKDYIYWILVFLIFGFSVFVFLNSWLFVFHWTCQFLNKLTGGHAVGAIGLVLSFLGLLGEVYQVLTMFLA